MAVAVSLLLAAGAVLLVVRAAWRAPVGVETAGTVQGRETNVASKISGRVTAVYVEVGDAVHAGDLLAEIDSTELQALADQSAAALTVAHATVEAGTESVANAEAQLQAVLAEEEGARAALARTEAWLGQAQKDLARNEALYADGILPRASLDAAETERDTRQADVASAHAALGAARARAEAARSALQKARADTAALQASVAEARDAARVAQARLADTRIVSPVDAVVDYRAVEPGEVVSPGTAVITLVDMANLWVRVDLEQADAARVRSGMPATITLDGLAGRSFVGEVWDVAWEGEFATERDVTRGRQDVRTFRTRVRIRDASGLLRPGMTAHVSIVAAEPSP